MGGCSIWYMKMILPNSADTNDVTVAEPVSLNMEVAKTEPEKTVVKSPVSPVAKTQSATAAGTLDVDINAIAASANDIYDDSAVEAQITSSEPTLLSNAYGI